jgi:putative aldouronate transport system permease protein
MIGIVLVWYIVFAYIPMFGLIVSFQKFNFAKGYFKSEFIGLANFKLLFSDKYFRQALKNTFVISGLRILFQFPAPIIFALILNEIRSKKYRSIVQTVTYIPHFFSWIIMSGLVMMILSPDRGIVNLFLEKAGYSQIHFLSSVKWFRTVIITTDLLKEIGWSSIIFIAAIAGINHTLYESATIDGANRRQLLLHVTIPSIAPVISIMFILYVGNVFGQGFDQLFNLYSPVVFEKGDILSTYIIRTLREQPNLGVQAAAGFVNSLICLAFLLFSNWLVRKSGQESIY